MVTLKNRERILRKTKKSVSKKVKKKVKKNSKKIQKIEIPVIEEIPVVAKKKRRRKKKSTGSMYFTQETEDAIVRYNNEIDLDIRDKIYRECIEFPLQKLVENVFNRFGFTYFETSSEDVQKEALAHLVSNMGKYDPNKESKTFGENKKSKAFSYFSVIAKNWFILLNNNNYKKFQQNVEISEERGENTVQLQHNDKYHTQAETDEFMELIIEFWENNLSKIFNKQRDLDIANAVVELLRRSNRIDAFNKKALYLYIREISECKTQQITKVINKMKQYYKNLYRTYLNEGVISTNLHV